jgi:peroxiredoxin Q/BCP
MPDVPAATGKLTIWPAKTKVATSPANGAVRSSSSRRAPRREQGHGAGGHGTGGQRGRVEEAVGDVHGASCLGWAGRYARASGAGYACPSGASGGPIHPSTLLQITCNNQPWSGECTVTTRLQVGDTAPEFTLTDDTGGQVSLADFRGRKVIVYFYPAAMTPGCTTQACDFSDSLDALAAQGYAVLGISPDAPAKLAKFRERDGLTITLLSDPDKATLTAYGAFGEKKLYGKTVVGCHPFDVRRRRGRARSPTRDTTSRPPGTWPSCARTSASERPHH